MASSDMPEIIGLSHRAFVMRGGALVGELDRDALDHPDGPGVGVPDGHRAGCDTE